MGGHREIRVYGEHHHLEEAFAARQALQQIARPPCIFLMMLEDIPRQLRKHLQCWPELFAKRAHRPTSRVVALLGVPQILAHVPQCMGVFFLLPKPNLTESPGVPHAAREGLLSGDQPVPHFARFRTHLEGHLDACPRCVRAVAELVSQRRQLVRQQSDALHGDCRSIGRAAEDFSPDRVPHLRVELRLNAPQLAAHPSAAHTLQAFQGGVSIRVRVKAVVLQQGPEELSISDARLVPDDPDAQDPVLISVVV